MKLVNKRVKRLFSRLRKHKGFTLIELLVVFAIIGIVTSLSIAGFNAFGKGQLLETSVSDIATIYSTAREKALSQVKICQPNQILNGYLVTINNPVAGSYQMQAVCDGVVVSPPLVQKSLPTGVSFAPGSDCSILFSVLTGTATPPGNIELDGYGRSKYIAISAVTGTITVNAGAMPGTSPCINPLGVPPTPTPTPPAIPTPTPTPHVLGILWGGDLDSYCSSLGYIRAQYISGSWRCIAPPGPPVLIDMNSACRWRFPPPYSGVYAVNYFGLIWACLGN